MIMDSTSHWQWHRWPTIHTLFWMLVFLLQQYLSQLTCWSDGLDVSHVCIMVSHVPSSKDICGGCSYVICLHHLTFPIFKSDCGLRGSLILPLIKDPAPSEASKEQKHKNSQKACLSLIQHYKSEFDSALQLTWHKAVTFAKQSPFPCYVVQNGSHQPVFPNNSYFHKTEGRPLSWEGRRKLWQV